jgi:Fe2+ transport system protein FeoA
MEVTNNFIIGEIMDNLLPLTNLQEGEKGIISFIRGGRKVIQRLTDMGLTPGTEITVTRHAPFGPIGISVRGSELAIGRSIAMKIFVKRK